MFVSRPLLQNNLHYGLGRRNVSFLKDLALLPQVHPIETEELEEALKNKEYKRSEHEWD
jgi:hypothetical protein